MSSPSTRISPAVGSMRRVRQRTSVDLPLPERPITTKTSPGLTSKDTSRTATVEPCLRRSSALDRSAAGVPMSRCSAGPKTFQRPLTEIPAAARSGDEPATDAGWLVTGGGSATDVTRWLPSRLTSPEGTPRRKPESALEPAARSRCRVLVDVLGLAVLVEAGRAQLPADAGLLEPTPFGLGHVRVVVVDP